VQQEFSNVYHFSSIGGTQNDANALVDATKAKEVQFHGGDVTFTRGRAWTSGGSQASNNMIVDKALTGVGGQANATSMDRERAVLVSWPAGNDSRGKPVFLRKWFHCCGTFAGVTFATSVLQQTSAIDSTSRGTIATAADAIDGQVVNGNAFDLVAKSGRGTTGGAQCHQYLEHHQLGDQWRS